LQKSAKFNTVKKRSFDGFHNAGQARGKRTLLAGYPGF